MLIAHVLPKPLAQTVQWGVDVNKQRVLLCLIEKSLRTFMGHLLLSWYQILLLISESHRGATFQTHIASLVCATVYSFSSYLQVWTYSKHQCMVKMERRTMCSVVHLSTVKCHPTPTTPSLWLHILQVLLWKNNPFQSQEGPLTFVKIMSFVPLIWES